LFLGNHKNVVQHCAGCFGGWLLRRATNTFVMLPKSVVNELENLNLRVSLRNVKRRRSYLCNRPWRPIGL
jgi:hypothetical protein